MYIVSTTSYNKTYGVVMTRECFNGEQATAYEVAMRYAYTRAEKLSKSGTEWSVTIQGKNWQTAARVNPM